MPSAFLHADKYSFRLLDPFFIPLCAEPAGDRILIHKYFGPPPFFFFTDQLFDPEALTRLCPALPLRFLVNLLLLDTYPRWREEIPWLPLDQATITVEILQKTG